MLILGVVIVVGGLECVLVELLEVLVMLNSLRVEVLFRGWRGFEIWFFLFLMNGVILLEGVYERVFLMGGKVVDVGLRLGGMILLKL